MDPTTRRRRPIGAVTVLLALSLALGALGTAFAAGGYRGPGPIHLDNSGALPYTGRADLGDATKCDPAKPDEWHFIINGLNTPVSGSAITPPDYITAVYRDPSGAEIVDRTNRNRAEAGYTEYGHLTDTLVDAYMTLPDGQNTWGGQFLLSHAPCPRADIDPPLTIAKTATPAYERSYHWTVTKTADPSQIDTFGSSAEVGYRVGVSRDSGTDGAWQVDGGITVGNPNNFAVTATVEDTIAGGTGECTIGESDSATTEVTVPAQDSLTLPYSCTFASAPDPTGTNTATVSWASLNGLEGGTATAEAAYDFGAVVPKIVDDCVTVTDAHAPNPELGTVCAPEGSPATEFTYSRTLPVTPSTCTDHDNTAVATTDDTGTTARASASVRVCGPVAGGRSMGFWTNKNGQGIILRAGPPTGTCSVAPFLRQYAPFADLSATASCSAVANYTTKVIRAANASGASMNAMLKAQMLATALDVHFSSPTSGNPLGAPTAIGEVRMNLAKACSDLACTTFIDTSTVPTVFGGATCMRVSDMLAYAASRSNVGGSTWYAQVKSPDQEYAKDAFEMIDNERAFACL